MAVRSARTRAESGPGSARATGGRPTKYTAPVALAIVTALGDRASRSDAARRAGVSPAVVYDWLQRGRAGHPDFAPFAAAVALADDKRQLERCLTGFVCRRRGAGRIL